MRDADAISLDSIGWFLEKMENSRQLTVQRRYRILARGITTEATIFRDATFAFGIAASVTNK